MRLATRIIRTPFTLPGTVIAEEAALTEIDLWKRQRRKYCDQHFRDVVEALGHLNQNPLSISSGYRHTDAPPDSDLPIGEWWSVISYDGPAE